MSVKPITPRKAALAYMSTIPDFVIEVVNTVLAEKSDGSGRMITISQHDITNRIKRYLTDIEGADPEDTANMQIDPKWLDFEPLFRQAGWNVKYDKPGYNETYEAFFEFKPSNETN